MYVRCTDGRTHDVITKPKFLALMGLPKSLSYGAPRAPAFGARGAPLIELKFAGVNMFLARLRLMLSRPQARAKMSSEKGQKHIYA